MKKICAMVGSLIAMFAMSSHVFAEETGIVKDIVSYSNWKFDQCEFVGNVSIDNGNGGIDNLYIDNTEVGRSQFAHVMAIGFSGKRNIRYGKFTRNCGSAGQRDVLGHMGVEFDQ